MKKVIIYLVIVMVFILVLGLDGSNLKSRGTNSTCKPEQLRQIYSDYTIVSDSELDELQNKVKDNLKQDWRPIGGISFDNKKYHQVMVMPIR
jgi:hypothetical protein